MRLNYAPAIKLEALRQQLIVPAFELISIYPGVSRFLRSLSIPNTASFSFKLPVSEFEDFNLAVSYLDGEDRIRYKLADNGILHVPLYAGEPLGPNAKLEIWSVDGVDYIISPSFTLELSALSFPDLVAYSVSGAYLTATLDDEDSSIVEDDSRYTADSATITADSAELTADYE